MTRLENDRRTLQRRLDGERRTAVIAAIANFTELGRRAERRRAIDRRELSLAVGRWTERYDAAKGN